MLQPPKILFWFRRDLRLADNPALFEACQQGQVLPVYIFDDDPQGGIGAAQQWWLHHSLACYRLIYSSIIPH